MEINVGDIFKDDEGYFIITAISVDKYSMRIRDLDGSLEIILPYIYIVNNCKKVNYCNTKVWRLLY